MSWRERKGHSSLMHLLDDITLHHYTLKSIFLEQPFPQNKIIVFALEVLIDCCHVSIQYNVSD